jgi:hypothetical protein
MRQVFFKTKGRRGALLFFTLNFELLADLTKSAGSENKVRKQDGLP